MREHAEGRVWSGIDATAIGLVDHIGGLDAAIESAKAEAGIPRARVAFYPRIRRSLLQRLVSRPFAALSLPTAGLPGIHDIFELAGMPLLIQPESIVPLFGTDTIAFAIRALDNRGLNVLDADL